MYGREAKMMELYIETLTGTAFELRVSPYETIQDVKARIQKLEGIPMCQQHLIWRSIELEDDYSLRDYSIHDGASLKLVLTMRGGPINTRRIPVDDPALRDMAEYYFLDGNREEFMEKLPGNRPMTVIVYHNGDQLNFFRVVDRDSTSPLSGSLSGASMYNLCDEEDEEDEDAGEEEKEETQENNEMREKMKMLKLKMENLNVSKKPKKKMMVPRPPSSGRPGSRSRFRRTQLASANQRQLQDFASTPLLNPNTCLPPVGQTNSEPEPLAECSVPRNTCSGNAVKSTPHREGREEESGDGINSLLRQAKSAHRTEFSQEMLLKSSAESSCKKEISLDGIKDSLRPTTSTAKTLECVMEDGGSSGPGRPTPSSRNKDLSLEAFKESLGRPHTSKKIERKQPSVILESLHPSEVRDLSGMLNSIVRSASKSRTGYTLSGSMLREMGRIATPEGRRMKMSAGRDGRVMSPSTNRLPPVKQKKKSSKRCFICSKKTGLATSFQCRCGNNFCATHRYAEVHNCTFDYKSEGRKIIEQANPVVTAPKLPKI